MNVVACKLLVEYAEMKVAVPFHWRFLRRLAVGFLILLSVGTIGALYVAGRLVAPATRAIGAPPPDLHLETAHLRSESGSSIATWCCTPPEAVATVVLVHGIGADRRVLIERARALLARKFAVVLIDLQAHRESPGRRITLGYLEKFDIQAAVAFARKCNPHHRIGVIGISLGGAATLLASPLGVDAIVVESVFPTLSSAIRNRVRMSAGLLSPLLTPLLLWQIRPRIGVWPSDLQPIDYISQAGCPVLVASGDEDRGTTLAETQALYAAARQPKELVVFHGTAHVDLHHACPQQYERDVLPFLTRWLVLDHGENAPQ